MPCIRVATGDHKVEVDLSVGEVHHVVVLVDIQSLAQML